MRNAIALALLLSIPAAAGPPAPGTRRNFVACPVVQDTRTVPCWLAEYDGETYFLAVQEDTGADLYPPQLQHQVLVEGTVAAGPRVCGGIPLKPVNLSVLPEVDRACSVVLPAQDSIAAPPVERGAGPAPPRSNLAGARPEPAPPAPPFESKEFTIHYDFDSDQVLVRLVRTLDSAARYALAIHASTVEVHAWRGAARLSNGKTLVERDDIARRRATQIGDSLRALGVPASSLDVRWEAEPEPADGIHDPEQRRVTILVRP